MNKISGKFAFYSAIAVAVLTVLTFGFAMIAIPPSGPYCPENCMEYPYSDLLKYYPRDYYWMYLSIFQLFAFIIFIVSVHQTTPIEKRIFSSISVVFALISALVLLLAYYTQFAVVPISMLKGETDGIALITQYNGHGLFIAMEELGYITMSISLFFMAFVFPSINNLNKSLRLILILPLILIILSFVIYSIRFGIDRSYRFEVAAIAINWLFLIAGGILSSIHFRCS
jgi:hypothetical protein